MPSTSNFVEPPKSVDDKPSTSRRVTFKEGDVEEERDEDETVRVGFCLTLFLKIKFKNSPPIF